MKLSRILLITLLESLSSTVADSRLENSFENEFLSPNFLQFRTIEIERARRDDDGFGSGWDAGMECPTFQQSAQCTANNIIRELHWKTVWSCKNECEADPNCKLFAIIGPLNQLDRGTCTLYSSCTATETPPTPETDIYVCRSLCDNDPCGNGDCTSISDTDYTCDCDAGYEFDETVSPKTCINIDECNDPNVAFPCDPNASCSDLDGFYNCDCNDGYRGDGWSCTTACDLFGVSCNINSGFSVTIDGACAATQYSHLPGDYSGLFVYSTDLVDNPGALTDLSTLPAACQFTASGSINVGFGECGGANSANPADADYTVFKLYANHLVSIGNQTSSMMSQVPLECRLSHITVGSETDLGVADSDELAANYEIDSDNIISTFDISLELGLVRQGNFIPFDDEQQVDIGDQIRVRLDNTVPTTYSFVLFDCTAVSGGLSVVLFDDNCPNEVSSRVNLEKIDYRSFDISVFKLSGEDSISFTCTVKMYTDQASIPECSRRRRRQATEENSEDDGDQVTSVTLHIGSGGREDGNLQRGDTNGFTVFYLNQILFASLLFGTL